MALNPLFPDEEPRALSVGKPNIPDFIPEAEPKPQVPLPFHRGKLLISSRRLRGRGNLLTSSPRPPWIP